MFYGRTEHQGAGWGEGGEGDIALRPEERAAEIGCASVHENNGRWMPCADERELHRQLRKQ